MNKTVQKLLLIVLASWLAMTIAVDFLAVPNVFRNVSDLDQAGQVGIKVFSGFNTFETLFGFFFFISFLYLSKNGWINRFKKALAVLSFCLLAFSLGYNYFLTPKITKLSQQLREYRTQGQSETPEFKTVEKEHSTYHHLYVRLDSIKILLLLVSLVLVFKESTLNPIKEE